MSDCSKNTLGSIWHSPKEGRFSYQVINLTSPRKVKAPKVQGFRSRHTSTDCQPSQDTPDQICVKTEYSWVLVMRPTKWSSMAQGLFEVGPGAGLVIFTVPSFWSANTDVSMNRSPWEKTAYEFVLTSPAVLGKFCLSYLNGLWDKWR